MASCTEIQNTNEVDWKLDRKALLNLRKGFLEFIKQTNRPESFPEFHTNAKPDRNDDFQIITRFDVNKEKRLGEFVFCSECQKPKFYEGGWLIRDKNSALYFIGPKCGEKFYGLDRFQREVEFTQNYVESELAEAHLINAISTIDDEIIKSREVLKIAIEIQSLIKSCKSMDGKLKAILKRSLKNDGALKITTIQNEFDQKGEIKEKFVEKTVATIVGYDLFFCKIDIVNQAKIALKELQATFEGKTTENDRIDLLTTLEKENKLIPHYQLYKKAIADINEISEINKNVLDFFSYKNFAEITKWGTDQRNEIKLSIIAKPQIRRIVRITKGDCNHLIVRSRLLS